MLLMIAYVTGMLQGSHAWTTGTTQTFPSIRFRCGTSVRTGMQSQSQSMTDSTHPTDVPAAAPVSSSYMNFGILLSSFTDGMTSPSTQQFFQYALTTLLTMDAISQTQNDIEESAKFSPCQGPNVDLLDQLERGDALFHDIGIGMDIPSDRDRMELTKRMVEYLDDIDVDIDVDKNSNHWKEIRVVYIPTAMYALRADSKNSPGKQRQRARADGKKRRNQLVRYIQDMYSSSTSSSTSWASTSSARGGWADRTSSAGSRRATRRHGDSPTARRDVRPTPGQSLCVA